MDNVVYCAKCGQVIPAERVEAIPGVKYCVVCQSGVEHAPPPPPANYSGEFCPRCKKKGIDASLVWRRPRDRAVLGEFLSCSRYPACLYSDRDSMRNLSCSDHEKASPGQVAWLVKRGMSKPEAKSLTAKAAAKQIDQLKAGKGRKTSPATGKEPPGGSQDMAKNNSSVVPPGDSGSRMPWPALPQADQVQPALPDADHHHNVHGVGNRPELYTQPKTFDKAPQMTPKGGLGITKKLHPHAYEKWTPAEERLLRVAFQEGQTIKGIAAILQRKAGGIRSRLIKLGLIEKSMPQNKGGL